MRVCIAFDKGFSVNPLQAYVVPNASLPFSSVPVSVCPSCSTWTPACHSTTGKLYQGREPELFGAHYCVEQRSQSCDLDKEFTEKGKYRSKAY